MKSVLISIQPKWCELIANGSKTIEVRKTKPKLETPFKVYIYATKSGDRLVLKSDKVFEISKAITGKVIGEFVCDEIECFTTDYRANKEQTERISKQSCVSWLGMAEYEYNSHCLYGWHISNLVIYDKPRELSEFKKECKLKCDMRSLNEPPCEKCDHHIIKRPPQSWCYVEREVDTE